MMALLGRLLPPRPAPPEHAWRVVIIDPDAVPGDIYLLSMEEAAELVTWLRRRTRRAASEYGPTNR